MHWVNGGQMAPLGPQPVGGGKQAGVPGRQHWPFMHTDGAMQAAPLPHPGGAGTQRPIWQTEPSGQGAPWEQSTATHWPSRHWVPGGQSGQAGTATQRPSRQVAPIGHGLAGPQGLGRQTWSTQACPGGQPWSPMQEAPGATQREATHFSQIPQGGSQVPPSPGGTQVSVSGEQTRPFSQSRSRPQGIS